MLEEGTLIDAKYRIVRKIGEGGMGAVFEGEAIRIHRRVAIKVMLPGQDAEQLARRFQLEAQAAGRIGSSHIVEVIDLGALESGEQFMVMEFLEGESMRTRLSRVGRLPPAELIGMLLQLLDALAAAHSAHIIHRDLKPDNVFLVKQPGGDFVKLLDFGVSKFSAAPGSTDMSLTRTGSVLGTPFYMSPEQASGKPVDHRADLYAVGVILYEGLAGSVPFTGESFNELLFKIVLEQPHSLRERAPGLDERLYALVERSMARDPGDRFQSAAEMQAALAAWMPAGHTTLAHSGVNPLLAARSSSPSIRPNTLGSWAKSRAGGELPSPEPRARPLRWAAAAAIVAAVLATAAFFLFNGARADTSKPASASSSHDGGVAARTLPEPVMALPREPPPTITPSDLPVAVPSAPPPSESAASEPSSEKTTRASGAARTPRASRPLPIAPPATPVSPPRPAPAPVPTPVAAPSPPAPVPAPAPKDDTARTQSGRYIRSDF